MEDVLMTQSQGIIHPCYVFTQRLVSCIKREYYYSRMCQDEAEDFYECRMKRKIVQLPFRS